MSGLTTVRVDNQLVSGLFSSRSESWRRRRHILTPAFSGRKMKLVSFNQPPIVVAGIIMLVSEGSNFRVQRHYQLVVMTSTSHSNTVNIC